MRASLELANRARLDNALDKKYSFNGRVSTFREEIASGAFIRAEVEMVPSVEYSRIKFNRMDNREQAEYKKKLATMKAEYCLYRDEERSIKVPKMVYDYYVSLKRRDA